MSNNNIIAKNVIFLYIRMALSMIVSLYTVRVVLQVLGVEDYGIYSAVGGIVSSLTIFTSALSTASQRFFSIEIGKGDIDGLNRLLSSMVLLYFFAGVIILIITETAGVWFLNHKMNIPYVRMDEAFVILQCTLISFFVSIIVSPFQAIIIAKEDMKIYAYVSIYDVLTKLFIVYIIQLFEADKLILYAILLLFVSVSTQFIYLTFTILKYRDIKPTIFLGWNPSILKSIIGFSAWSFVGSLAFLCNAQGLNLLLNVFFGPIVNTAYNIANIVKNAVTQLSGNFFVAVRPRLIKEYAANNLDYVRKLFLFSTKIIFCLLFMIIFPITIETPRILSLWLDEVGEYMIVFVRLMLVWALLLNLSDPITVVVQAANEVKRYHLQVDVFTLLSLPLAYIAFKCSASPKWAFIISLFVLCIAHVIRLLILKRIINIGIIEYFKNIVLRIFCAVSFSYVLSLIVNNLLVLENTLILLTKIIIEILIAISISYMVVLDSKERIRVNGMLVRIINKFRA